MDGLRSLGFAPVLVPDCPNGVVVDYVVETGKFAGKAVRLGFLVPADFPNTPPTGPHVSPHIHPLGGGSVHPTGGIHEQHSVAFLKAGGQWQYWSRPFMNWAQEKKSVAVYMSHIWRLWDTQ
jgi:hypothetical protein